MRLHRGGLLFLGLMFACSARSAELDAILEEAVASGRIPAVVGMVASADQTLYAGAFGLADVEREVPVRLDSLFRIASMTKPITSTAVMQLVERGALRLDAPMSDYLVAFESAPILLGVDDSGAGQHSQARYTPTLSELLTHTSGFGYSVWNQLLFATTDFSKFSPTYYQQQPLIFEPGAAWAYGTSTDWAGAIVEEQSGMSLEAYFAEKILRPLAMEDTAYNVDTGKQARVVTRHQRAPDGRLTELPNDDLSLSSAFSGGGGLKSTAGDYVRFMQMFLDQSSDNVVSAATRAAMSQNQTGSVTVVEMQTAMPNLSNDFAMHPNSESVFGYGFEINLQDLPGRRRAGSLAWAGLYNTYFWIDPESGLCGVLLAQLTPFFDAEVVETFQNFERAAYEKFMAN